MGDDFDFDQRISWQSGYLNRASRWKIAREKLGVNFVELRELVQVGHEHRGFDDVPKIQTLALKNSLDIFKHANGLRFNSASHKIHRAGGWIDPNPARTE